MIFKSMKQIHQQQQSIMVGSTLFLLFASILSPLICILCHKPVSSALPNPAIYAVARNLDGSNTLQYMQKLCQTIPNPLNPHEFNTSTL